jgi:hypothetical protein
MKLGDLSRAVGLGHYGSVGTAIKYLEQRRQADPKLHWATDELALRSKSNRKE